MKKTLFVCLVFNSIFCSNAQDISKLKVFEKQFIQGIKPTGEKVIQVAYEDYMQTLGLALEIKNYKNELENIGYKYYSTNKQRNYDTYINCDKKIILTLRPQWNGILIISLIKSEEKNRIEPLINGCENEHKYKKADKKDIEEKKEEERVINQNLLFPPTHNSNNSHSQGVAGGDGNQGKPNGGNSDNYSGSGQGNSGISYSLKGRHHKGLPKPKYTVNEEGKVVVEITVDRNGNVTSATPGIKGTTTTAPNLWTAAKKAALKTKFDKSSNSPKMQTGSITYHFVLR